jgi:hypothetical protein
MVVCEIEALTGCADHQHKETDNSCHVDRHTEPGCSQNANDFEHATTLLAQTKS